MSDPNEIQMIVKKRIDEIEKSLKTTSIGIALLGSNESLPIRRQIKRMVLEENPATTIFIPDDDVPREGNSTLYEKDILRRIEIDLVFIAPGSPGSFTEFGQFSENTEIARKMRVLVDHSQHPLHANPPTGYVTSAELVFLAKYGAVYAIRGTSDLFPDMAHAILIITDISRQVKYFEKSGGSL
jgi:vacuolar-type H+-ATPase subunit F/Vma7